MGFNLISGCHICKVKRFHFRRKESDTILPFYAKHEDCLRRDPKAVQTNIDQLQDEDWMTDYKEDIQIKLKRK